MQISTTAHLKLLTTFVDLPTAPFVETHVVQRIEEFVRARPLLRMRRDRFGNRLVTYTPPGSALKKSRHASVRPVLFAAHMDHPGFEAVRMIDERQVLADWRGWVPSRYFQNEKIQFHSGGRWIEGIIHEVILPERNSPRLRRAASSARSFGADAPPKGVVARVRSAVDPGSPGMWAVGNARRRGHLLNARVCDDIAGLSAVLCALDEICRRRVRSRCYAFFTRAEEVGFAGALAAVADRTVPRRAIVVAVECSKVIPGVEQGGGPILRVGDKATVFTPAATAYCQVVADSLAAKDRSFRYQRKLMDGGTCESTAYCHYGYDATGVCLALGHYHNVDATRGRIGPEYIDTRDYLNMVKWFVAIAEAAGRVPFDGEHPGLDDRLTTLLKQHRPRLLRTADLV